MGDEVWQGRKAPKDGLEDFPTPHWATRSFLFNVLPQEPRESVVWEPAANRGYMVAALRERFDTVIGSDIKDYGAGFPVIDFLNGPNPADYGQPANWVITNPPFNISIDFAERALDVASDGVALLLRTSWVEGMDRFKRLFENRSPHYIAQYVERVNIVPGQLDRKASRPTPYAWFVWDKRKERTLWPRFRWIPPYRAKFEKDEDYGVDGD